MADKDYPILDGAGNVILGGKGGNRNDNAATYSVSARGYAGYATPQDLVVLNGAAGKIIRVLGFRVLIGTTSAALQSLGFLKRSTLNTGGTKTQVTPIALDSRNPAPGATVDVYSAIPTAGTPIGVLAYQTLATAVLTAAPGAYTLVAALPTSVGFIPHQQIALRENECLAANWAGAALPAGFSMGFDIVWTETAAD